MKQSKHIRFEDSIIEDVDRYAAKHRLKAEDGSYDFSNAIHARYAELLAAEHETERIHADLATWKGYAGTQTNMQNVQCDFLKQEVSAGECRVCAEKRLNPKCVKVQPL